MWLATGATDMRRGMNSLTLQVQEAMGRDPHAGDLYVFRGRRGNLIKVLWHDGLGCSLYAKRQKIYPRRVHGIFRRAKWVIMALTLRSDPFAVASAGAA